MVVAAAALVGMGSSIFHPESSRVAHLASGGRHGFAQSVFQVGGNAGSSLGPLLAALIVVPYRQRPACFGSRSLLCSGSAFSPVSAAGIASTWPKRNRAPHLPARSTGPLPRRVRLCACHSWPAHFFEIFLPRQPNELLHLLRHRQIPSLDSGRAISSLPLSLRGRGGHDSGRPDRGPLGRKLVIWVSILGVAPFTLALPARQSFLDRRSCRHYRNHLSLRLFCDPGLRAGVGAWKSGADLGAISSASPSAWRALVRPFSGNSPIARASNTSSAFAPISR